MVVVGTSDNLDFMQNKNSFLSHGGVCISAYNNECKFLETSLRFLLNLVLSGFLRQKVNAEALRVSRKPPTQANRSLFFLARRTENMETDALLSVGEYSTQYSSGISICLPADFIFSFPLSELSGRFPPGVKIRQ